MFVCKIHITYILFYFVLSLCLFSPLVNIYNFFFFNMFAVFFCFFLSFCLFFGIFLFVCTYVPPSFFLSFFFFFPTFLSFFCYFALSFDIFLFLSLLFIIFCSFPSIYGKGRKIFRCFSICRAIFPWVLPLEVSGMEGSKEIPFPFVFASNSWDHCHFM